MKRKQSRSERCLTCDYFVLVADREMSGWCDLREYGVERWWVACKYYLTQRQRAELVREYVEGRTEPLQERIELEKEFYRKRAEEQR